MAQLLDHSDEKSLMFADSDDEDSWINSGANGESSKIGMFDVVKNEFRAKTAEITNALVDRGTPIKRPKINFIQNMKNKVGIAIEYKNRGMEEMQNSEPKLAMKYFHMALMHIKGLDPDEGVVWSTDFQLMDKERMPLRMMPSELKEIKEGAEIDCYMGLATCLQSKERVPYRRIKNYCQKILDFREDHIPALTRCGMACYYLREYELSRLHLQSAMDFSREPYDSNIKKYLHMVETQLCRAKKKK